MPGIKKRWSQNLKNSKFIFWLVIFHQGFFMPGKPSKCHSRDRTIWLATLWTMHLKSSDLFNLSISTTTNMIFFHYLNSRHINIRFTMEKESENRLPFLDVLIDNNQVPALTTVFRKPTFTGLKLLLLRSFSQISHKNIKFSSRSR